MEHSVGATLVHTQPVAQTRGAQNRGGGGAPAPRAPRGGARADPERGRPKTDSKPFHERTNNQQEETPNQVLQFRSSQCLRSLVSGLFAHARPAHMRGPVAVLLFYYLIYFVQIFFSRPQNNNLWCLELNAHTSLWRWHSCAESGWELFGKYNHIQKYAGSLLLPYRVHACTHKRAQHNP